ncbi:MAG: tetratricopeptide repeat protein, partial [FCB group bacterium]
MKIFLLTFILLLVITPQTHARSWEALIDSANYYQEKQDIPTAIIWVKEALPQAEKEFGKLDSNYISTLFSLAELYYYSGKLDSAIYYQEIHLK